MKVNILQALAKRNSREINSMENLVEHYNETWQKGSRDATYRKLVSKAKKEIAKLVKLQKALKREISYRAAEEAKANYD